MCAGNQVEARRMRKSLHSKDYKILTGLLIAARKAADLTQQDVADGLGRPQSFVAKVESGERRIDVVEFLQICRIMRADAGDIIRALKNRMGKGD